MPNEQMKKSVAKLRAVADYLESLANREEEFNSSVPLSSFNVFSFDAADFARLARAIGSFEKETEGTLFYIRKALDEDTEIDFCINRDKICQRVEEKRIIPAAPEMVLPATEEREEIVVRWECPESLLSPVSPA